MPESTPPKLKIEEFGTRKLTEEKKVFEQNAWDDFEWGEEQEQEAQSQISIQAMNPVPPSKQKEFNADPAFYWNEFYSKNNDKFFKDRKWLEVEFPELFGEDVEKMFEIGCGAGNTVYPFLEKSTAFAYCCDYSSEAVDIVKVFILIQNLFIYEVESYFMIYLFEKFMQSSQTNFLIPVKYTL